MQGLAEIVNSGAMQLRLGVAEEDCYVIAQVVLMNLRLDLAVAVFEHPLRGTIRVNHQSKSFIR